MDVHHAAVFEDTGKPEGLEDQAASAERRQDAFDSSDAYTWQGQALHPYSISRESLFFRLRAHERAPSLYASLADPQGFLEDALRIVGRWVEHYNRERLHSAIGYVAPMAMLEGRQKEIHDGRDEKLARARIARQNENNQRNNDAEDPLAA